MKMKLKDKLRDLREKNCFTQEEVANALDVNRSTYTYYETGKTEPSLDKVRTLAKLYNVSTEDLLEDEVVLTNVLNDSSSNFEVNPSAPSYMAELTEEERHLIASFRIASPKERRKAALELNKLEKQRKNDVPL